MWNMCKHLNVGSINNTNLKIIAKKLKVIQRVVSE